MNECMQRAVDHLSPRIGRMTATKAVVLAVSKMGISPDDVSRSDLPEIARNISTVLRIFLGSEAASQLELDIANLEVDE